MSLLSKMPLSLAAALLLDGAHCLQRILHCGELHHLAGFFKLLQPAVHYLPRCSAAGGDALAAAAVDDFGVLAFVGGH